MSFETLIPEIAEYGGEVRFMTEHLSAFYNRGEREPVRDVTEMYLGAAKVELLLDLQGALGLAPSDPDDMARIDAIADYQAPKLRRALALKQLFFVYQNSPGGEVDETANGRKRKRYEGAYDRMSRTFGSLSTPRGTSSSVTLRIR